MANIISDELTYAQLDGPGPFICVSSNLTEDDLMVMTIL